MMIVFCHFFFTKCTENVNCMVYSVSFGYSRRFNTRQREHNVYMAFSQDPRIIIYFNVIFPHYSLKLSKIIYNEIYCDTIFQ